MKKHLMIIISSITVIMFRFKTNDKESFTGSEINCTKLLTNHKSLFDSIT